MNFMEHRVVDTESWIAEERELAAEMISAGSDLEIAGIISRRLQRFDRWMIGGCALVDIREGKLRPWLQFLPKEEIFDEERNFAAPACGTRGAETAYSNPGAVAEWFKAQARNTELGPVISFSVCNEHPDEELRVFLVLQKGAKTPGIDEAVASYLSMVLKGAWRRFGFDTNAGATVVRTRNLLDHAHELVLAVNTQGTISYANTAWLQTMNCDFSRVVGSKVFQYFTSECADLFSNCFDQALHGRREDDLVVEMISGKGIPVKLEINCIPHRRHGKIVGIYLFGVVRQDGLESAKSDHLTDIDSIFDAIDNSGEGLAILVNDLYVYMNRSHAQIYGYEPEALIGQSWHRIYSKSERDRIASVAFPVLVETGHWRGLTRGLKNDGSNIDVEVALSMTSAGHLICCCRDVSPIVESNKKLAHSCSMLAGLSRLYNVWLAGESDTHTLFNKLLGVALELSESPFGFLGEALHDASGNPYLKAHAVTDIAWDQKSRDVFDQIVSGGFEFRNLNTLFGAVLSTEALVISNDPESDDRSGGTPEGHPPLKCFAGIPVKSGGKMIGMVGLANKDGGYSREQVEALEPMLLAYSAMIVALRAQRERDDGEIALRQKSEQLTKVAVELSESSRMKDQFIASMSHELRTPLSGILNLSEALSEEFYGPLNDKQRDYLQRIRECGEHLLKLINEILDLAKTDAGMTEIHPELCSVKEICESSIRMVEGARGLKDAIISLKLPNGDFTFQADNRLIKQALVNLLSNALKFSQHGDQTELEAGIDHSDSVVRFYVRDSGIGIPEHEIKKMFEPFVQLDDGFSRRFPGTGLGLALTRQMVHLHGGQVHARNRESKGCEFTIVLPVKTGASDGIGTNREINDSKGSAKTTETKERIPLRILLVEDNAINIESITDYLSAAGHHVTVARNGLEGVEKTKSELPNLVLMDIQMPVMDGLEAIRSIRSDQDPRVARVPVIALTALAMSTDRDKCMQAGADDYIAKPIKLRALAAQIDAHANRDQSE